MKTLLSVLCLCFLISQDASGQLGSIQNKNIKYNSGRSIFIWTEQRGLVHMSKSDDGKLTIALYNEQIEKVKSFNVDYKVLNTVFVDCISDGDELHFFFIKNGYIGFKNQGKLYDIKLKNDKISVNNYKFPGALNIANIDIEDGVITVFGGELYKPWDAMRVLKFAVSPFLLGMPLIIPKSPSTRPVIAELKDGKVNLINRKAYKKRHYKNKLIHMVHKNPDGTSWLALTNGIKPGKTPVFIEKYTPEKTISKSISYKSSRNTRVSLFQFDDTLTNNDSVAFTVGFGKNVLLGPILKRGGIQSITGIYQGFSTSEDGNNGQLKVNDADNEIKTANDPFSRDVPSAIQKNFTAKRNDTLFKIHMLSYLLPLYESDGKNTVLVGYYFTPPRITVTNTISKRVLYFELTNPDDGASKTKKNSKAARNKEAQRIAMQGHFCYTDYLTNDLFHATVLQDSQQFYIAYIDPKGTLTLSEPGSDNFVLNEVYSEPVQKTLKKGAGHGSSYRLMRTSEDKLMVLVTTVPLASLFKKTGKTTTFVELFELE